jgi:hypothetical protein
VNLRSFSLCKLPAIRPNKLNVPMTSYRAASRIRNVTPAPCCQQLLRTRLVSNLPEATIAIPTRGSLSLITNNYRAAAAR